MNYKQYFPIYRKRVLFLNQLLNKLASENGAIKRILNLGAGEGELNHLIHSYCEDLYACDINEDDVEFGKTINPLVVYSVQDGSNLSYQNNYFDVVICMEVLEHVEDEEKLLKEIYRVLIPGGLTIITFPSINFPITYDPFNFILAYFNLNLPIGAYAFGHTKLLNNTLFEATISKMNFKVVNSQYLSHYFSGLIEMYWVGLAQYLFKLNSRNNAKSIYKSKKFPLRPKSIIVDSTLITDIVIYVDDFFFNNYSLKSIGLGYLLKKTITITT